MTARIPDGHHLVCYDYGMGGVWWLIKAGLPDDIREASPNLIVFDEVPGWMQDDDLQSLPRDDLTNPQSEALRMILAGKI